MNEEGKEWKIRQTTDTQKIKQQNKEKGSKKGEKNKRNRIITRSD